MPIIETKAELREAILKHLKIGEENAIKGKQLAVLLGEKGTRQIRIEIAELRHSLKPIISSNKGYFLAKDLDDILKAKDFLRSYIIELCKDLRDYKNIANNYTGQIRLII
jgi:hypothetical protein